MNNLKQYNTNNTQTAGTIRLLHIGSETATFQRRENNTVTQEIKLETGYRYLVDKFFKQEIPTDAETDYAINYIEDQLMSDRNLLHTNEQLVSSDKLLIELFRKNELLADSYSRQNVEDLFSRYARVIMGAPASELNTPITRTDFAILLLLREIMHHLGFETINLIG